MRHPGKPDLFVRAESGTRSRLPVV